MRISDWSSDVALPICAREECRGICAGGEGMRIRKMMPGLFGVALLAAIPAHAQEAEAAGAARVTIVTSDVDRFYSLSDDPALAAPPDVVAARYLATPTPGLAGFMALRRITPAKPAPLHPNNPPAVAMPHGSAGRS